LASAAAGGTCGTKSCWTDKPHGFTYADKTLAHQGLARLQLQEGIDGKAKIQASMKRDEALVPPILSLTSPLVVQLVVIGFFSGLSTIRHGGRAT
jgi:hypothetical protein